MRLQTYLVNEGRTKSIPESQFIEMLRKDYDIAAQAAVGEAAVIFRGIDITLTDSTFYFADPTKGKLRRSANTSNYYTLIMDNHSSWKSYPKRGRAFICTTDIGYSDTYGNPFLVLPRNDANIGVCYQRDLWGSFPFMKQKTDMYYMEDFTSTIEYYMDWVYERGADKNIASMRKAFKNFDNKAKAFNYDWKKIFDQIYNNVSYVDTGEKALVMKSVWQGSLMKTCAYLMDPKSNNFEMRKVGQNLPSDREVWTDSPCLFIDLSANDPGGRSYQNTLDVLDGLL